jgi:7-cyano-7-deazaguanine synthase
MSDVVVIVSGGMDSITLLYDIISQGHRPHVVTFNYNQRHKKEIDCAKYHCELLHVSDHYIVDLSVLNELADSCLTRPNLSVPEGNYDEPSMKATVVPNRNMVMLSLATAFAISTKSEAVYYGAHSGDHTIYPDCRPEFIKAMDTAMKLCDWRRIELRVPYMRMTKADILRIGKNLNVDYSQTWTCYKGEAISCGQCGSCRERLEAFEIANMVDPIAYQEGTNRKPIGG